MAAGHRSIHPNVPGAPWWVAVVIAATATAVGFAFEAGSGNKELTNVFAALYVLGCLAAVLAVAQSAVFTAVIQPPLILFCAVPGAYWLFHGANFTGVKDLLINCGYPLIERFPLMLFTSAGVLLIGMGRWYFGMSTARSNAAAATANAKAGTTPSTGGTRRVATVAAKITSIWSRDSIDQADHAGKAPAEGARRRDTIDRPARAAKPAAAGRPAKRRAPESPPQPRRRPKPPLDPSLHDQPPREIHRDPHVREERPAARSSRFDPSEPMEPYDPPPPRRRQAPKETIGANATHHPVSRVRYRGSAPTDEPREAPRTRPRGPRRSDADSWKYDI